MIHVGTIDGRALLSVRHHRIPRARLGRSRTAIGATLRRTFAVSSTSATIAGPTAGQFVEAWTVNDVASCNDLLAGGVDAIATENLALLAALREALGLGRGADDPLMFSIVPWLVLVMLAERLPAEELFIAPTSRALDEPRPWRPSPRRMPMPDPASDVRA